MRFITEKELERNLGNVVSFVKKFVDGRETCARGILTLRDGEYFVCDNRWGKTRNFRVTSGCKVYLGEDRRKYEVVLKKAD